MQKRRVSLWPPGRVLGRGSNNLTPRLARASVGWTWCSWSRAAWASCIFLVAFGWQRPVGRRHVGQHHRPRSVGHSASLPIFQPRQGDLGNSGRGLGEKTWELDNSEPNPRERVSARVWRRSGRGALSSVGCTRCFAHFGISARGRRHLPGVSFRRRASPPVCGGVVRRPS